MKITRFIAAVAVCSIPMNAYAQDSTAPEAAPRTSETSVVPELDMSEPKAPDNRVKVRAVLEGLNNPCGVAVQPETQTVFVADSGNYQIVKFVNGEAKPVITDFPKDVYGKGPKVNVGPLGLLFLDKDTLVVGGGGQPDGQELLRVYRLPEDGKPIKADAMDASFSLPETDEIKGEGNFYALATDGEAVYVTCNGDDTKGWVARATIKDGTLTDFKRYLATKEATEVDAPVGIAVSPTDQGKLLVVGQMGEISIPGDSLLTYYNADKKMRLNIETGLNDICAVAYSQEGRLYVLDYSWADSSQGGLFQIVADDKADNGVKTIKLLDIDKPTAMAFASDGSLYITAIGVAKDANSEGMLLMVPVGGEL